MQEILYRNGVFYLNNEDRKANFESEEDEKQRDLDSFVDETKLKYRGLFYCLFNKYSQPASNTYFFFFITTKNQTN
jgi:hypothetical protein